VIVAKGDQGAEFEFHASGRLSVFLYLVLNDGAVLTVDHEDGFFDLDALDFIGEYGEGIEAKVFQKAEALGVDDAGITIGGKIEGLAIDEQGFFQLGEHDHAPDRRLGGGDEKSMVAARVESDDGRGGETSQTVGLKPFAGGGGGEVSADFVVELDHGGPLHGKTPLGGESDRNSAFFKCEVDTLGFPRCLRDVAYAASFSVSSLRDSVSFVRLTQR